MEAELEKAHKELVDASRLAGMAEVATGVLHNVGNVLNSLNVSASVIATGLKMSKAESLGKVGALLRENKSNLAHFIAEDPKGKRVPEFIASMARHAVEERDRLLKEVAALQNNIDHIKDIVSMQQTYATMVGVVEALDPVALMEDSLRMNAGALVRHEVRVIRKFQSVPPLLGEKAKILQILVNLIRNAKYACDETGQPDKVLTLGIAPSPTTDRVQLFVQDNGVGIAPENLTRIFGHGFTTRSNGHGFGLHSSANAAREMKGTLTVHSEGPGRGATFTLDLPLAPPPAAAP
jgi:C4-dicarboxylate-specific signal transduction histidine kinase